MALTDKTLLCFLSSYEEKEITKQEATPETWKEGLDMSWDFVMRRWIDQKLIILKKIFLLIKSDIVWIIHLTEKKENFYYEKEMECRLLSKSDNPSDRALDLDM